MRISRLQITVKNRRYIALAAAAIFHLIFTFSVFSVGHFGLAPQKFDRDGIGEFARDGHFFKPAMDELVKLLRGGHVSSWISSGDDLHVKIYSLAALLFEPFVGSNILAIEPINLLYYLSLLALTFTLANILSGERAAWLAAAIVGLWPSLLLHTTQLLRDPLILTCLLALFTILALTLKQRLKWRQAAVVVVVGVAAIYIVWQTRPEMWLLVAAFIFLAAALSLLKAAVTRKLLAINFLAVALLATCAIAMPRPIVGVLSRPLTNDSPIVDPADPPNADGVYNTPALWYRIAFARRKFILHNASRSGSSIDGDVLFRSTLDVVRYVPRALEIGYFAPFPSMWVRPGYNVGLAGRIMSGVEMLVTYLLEVLACFFVWQNRTHFTSWFLAIVTAMGALALGLVITNLGTLYRMRYPFWILLVVMGSGALTSLYTARGSSGQRPGSRHNAARKPA